MPLLLDKHTHFVVKKYRHYYKVYSHVILREENGF